MKPRLLYLHGFASGPDSAKGVAVANHLATKGLSVERLDLRKPAPDALSLRAMCACVEEAIGEETLLIGSSLGGLVALKVAERDARVRAMILLAPAIHIAERWRAQLGEARFAEWMQSGWLPLPDHADRGLTGVPASFGRELAEIDVGTPTLSIPTAIAHGLRDSVVPIEGSRELVRRSLASQAPPITRLLELDDEHDLRNSIPALLDWIDDFLIELGVVTIHGDRTT